MPCGQLTESMMPTAKKVVQQISDIVKAFSKLDTKQKETILKIAGLVAAVGPALKIGGTAVTVIGKVVGGTGTLIKTIGYLKNGVGTATGTAAKLATAIKGTISPVGLLTVGIGAAAVGFALYQKHVHDATAESRAYKESTEELRDQISREIESINAVRQATDDKTAANLSELEYARSLNEELKTIVDENGRVKAGYEERAAYITGELSKATGIEIQNNNGVIESYKEIQKQIEATINRKKVETIIAGSEEKMAEAIENRDSKTKELLDTENKLKDARIKQEDASKKLEQAEKDLNYARQFGTGSQPFEAQAAYDAAKKNLENQEESVRNLETSYNDLNGAVKQYNDDIATYEEQQKLYAEGTAESIQKIIDQHGKTIKQNGKTTEISFQEQIQIQQRYRRQAKEEYDKAEKDHNEYEKNKSLTTDREAATRLQSLASELHKMTSTTGENSQDIIDGWKQLAQGSYKIYSEELAKMPVEERATIEQMTGVIAEKTPEAVAATNQSMGDILWAFDRDKDFRNEAITNLTSFLNGLKDDELRSLLEQAGIQDVDKVMQGIREGNLGESEGRSILQSLQTGLEDNTITNKLFSVARGLANKLTSIFKITPSVSIGPNLQSAIQRLPGFAEGLDYVPYDNFVARLHKGERVLTAEENKKLTELQNSGAKLNSQIRSGTAAAPNIVFNVQKMDEANLNACFNYINKKFGTAY